MAAGDGPVPPRLGELEAEIMEELWRRGEATVRSVLEALNATAEKARAYTTVMTVMGKSGAQGSAPPPSRGQESAQRSSAVGGQQT